MNCSKARRSPDCASSSNRVRRSTTTLCRVGNQTLGTFDLCDMALTDPPSITCSDAGELLSAREDGETTGAENVDLEHHLSGCTECSTLAAHISDLSRQLRFRPADPIPNLVGAITERTRPAVLAAADGYGQQWPGSRSCCLPRTSSRWSVAPRWRRRPPRSPRRRIWRGPRDRLCLRRLETPSIAWPAAVRCGTDRDDLDQCPADIIDGGRTVLAESAHITEVIGLALLWMIAGSPGWTRWTHWVGRHRHIVN